MSQPNQTPGEIRPFDIAEDRDTTVSRLRGSPEVEALTGTLDVYDLNSIVTFGSGAAEAISGAADSVLSSLSHSQSADSAALMDALARVMERFNASELKSEKSLLGKLFGGGQKLEKIIEKYTALGADIDRIYVQLRTYESEIRQSNDALETMFQANVAAFHELEKYIVAGEQGIAEIEAYTQSLREQQARTRDQSLSFDIQTLETALNMLRARVQDLRLSENVALQSIPMIRLTQNNNMSLARKINASLIVTMPVFKQALSQAILLKKQQNQAEAVRALDRSTQAMLRRNAQNGSAQAAHTALSALAAATDGADLNDAWRALTQGIEETRRAQADAQAQRDRDQKSLEAIRSAYREQHAAAQG